jgi:Kelch motif/Galactose oxidase, central domain
MKVCFYVDYSQAGPGTAADVNVTIQCGGFVVPAVSGLLPNTSVILKVSDPLVANGGVVAPSTWTVSADGQCTAPQGPINTGCQTVVDPSAAFTVTVMTQPVGEICTVGALQGTMGKTELTVPVVCVPASYTIGGTVSGLTAGESIVLEDNGGDPTTVSANGPFTFSTSIASESPYAVTVATPPAGESCAVTHGPGTTPAANVTNAAVTCAVPKEWTWQSGSDVQFAAGVYGTLGKPASGNVPGARYGLVSWVDAANNLWLFGGAYADASGEVGELNDLWKYNQATGLWTWLSGASTLNSAGSYGTQGAPAPSNVPGARGYPMSWTDSAGNFWLFGGTDAAGAFNDLWRYSPTTGQWAWMSGSTVTGAGGVYGTQDTRAPGNTPGARYSPMSWADEAGNLWLFGGTVYGGSFLNDLWEYSPSTGLWAWIGGSNQQRQVGVYGTLAVAGPANIAGARTGSATRVDGAGNFWLFGGDAFVSADPSYPGMINDLWRYVPPAP